MDHEIIIKDLGVTAYSVMNECERQGIMRGCTTSCTVLIRGECELKDGENKDLYAEALAEN